MATWIALLKAVNLGGATMVSMAELRALAAGLGFTNVRTLLHSGNLLFSCEDRDPEALEAVLEAAISERFGRPATVFVRDPVAWTGAIAANPFPDFARDDPSHLVLTVMKTAPALEAVADLRAAIVGSETVRAVGRELYFTYPDGIGDSKLTTAIIERRLGGATTSRNWNTVLKIAKSAA